jgi:hypothetical protein
MYIVVKNILYLHTLLNKSEKLDKGSLFFPFLKLMHGVRRGRDHMVVSWVYNYLCNQCLSPLKL